MEELPVVAQNEIKAQAGQAPVHGLAAQKKKVGFLERLANVGRSRKEPDAEMPAKREPEFGQRLAPQMPEAPRTQAPRPQPLGQPMAQKGIRIERPRHEQAPAAAPKRIEAQVRPLAVEIVKFFSALPGSLIHHAVVILVEMAATAPESFAEDDLEIPAFLRRRAN